MMIEHDQHSPFVDLDTAVVDGQIHLLGNGGVLVAELDLEQATTLRDMLTDSIALAAERTVP